MKIEIKDIKRHKYNKQTQSALVCPVCSLRHRWVLIPEAPAGALLSLHGKLSTSFLKYANSDMWIVLMAAGIMGREEGALRSKDFEFCSVKCMNKWIEENPEKITLELAAYEPFE